MLKIFKPCDFHVHLREGNLAKTVLRENNKNFQSLVKKISLKNTENISQIESKLISLKDEKSKFINRFKAYNY